MRSNMYIMHDRVSHVYGDIFECPNDETLKRFFLSSIPSMVRQGLPIKDTIVFRIGVVDLSGAAPVVVPDPVPYVILRGDEDEYVRAYETAISTFASDSVREAL